MKSIRSSMLFKVFILAIGALGASAIPAHAQSATGKFTLTHEARWGNVLLSPGVYSFALQSPSLPAAIMVGKTGAAQVAIVLPAARLGGKTQRRQHPGADSHCGRRILRERAVSGRSRFESSLFGAQVADGNRIGETGTHRRVSTRQVKLPMRKRPSNLVAASAFLLSE